MHNWITILGINNILVQIDPMSLPMSSNTNTYMYVDT